MRAVRAFSLGVVMSLVLGAGVASAAPGQSGWDGGSGQLFDGCTGENVDNDFTVHTVATGSGHFHLNIHIEGIGETSGARYVGNTNDNEFAHALPDGNFLIDQVLRVRLVSQGKLPNSLVLALHLHQVVDADGNVISGKIDINGGACQGT
jgi:hypothetical protein